MRVLSLENLEEDPTLESLQRLDIAHQKQHTFNMDPAEKSLTEPPSTLTETLHTTPHTKKHRGEGGTLLSNLKQQPFSARANIKQLISNTNLSFETKATYMLDQLANTGILGLIQGLAEWLPISSTGHLKIAEHYLGLTTTPLFNLILHLGTLIVVIFHFRHDIINILSALVHRDLKSEAGKLVLPIIVATVPTAIIGLLYVQLLEDTLQRLLIIGITFIIGATLVYTSRTGKEDADNVTYRIALLMGVAQGLAIFPGLSRSGATISTALLLGLKREKAFKFSFLLSIPAILGDTAVEAYKTRGQIALSGIGYPEVLVGVAIAMIVGYIAIRIVSKAVKSKKFHYFAIYTWLLGITIIALALGGY